MGTGGDTPDEEVLDAVTGQGVGDPGEIRGLGAVNPQGPVWRPPRLDLRSHLGPPSQDGVPAVQAPAVGGDRDVVGGRGSHEPPLELLEAHVEDLAGAPQAGLGAGVRAGQAALLAGVLVDRSWSRRPA